MFPPIVIACSLAVASLLPFSIEANDVTYNCGAL